MSAEQEENEKEYKRLTIDELRGYPGCESYSDEEAKEIIDSLEEFSILLFRFFQENQNNKQL